MGGFGTSWRSAAKPQNGTIRALLSRVDAPVLDPGSNPEVIDLAGSASRGGGLLHEDAQIAA